MKHKHMKVGGGVVTHSDHDATVGHKHDGLMPMVKGAAIGPVKMGDPQAAVLRVELDTSKFLGADPRRVPYIRTGTWMFDDLGEFTVSDTDLDTLVSSFKANARRAADGELPVALSVMGEFGKTNEDHFPTRAVAWMKDLERDGDTVWATIEPTPYGEPLLKGRAYKYTSAEVLRNYTDAETGAHFPLVATGLALTNKPRLKSLPAIPLAASEAGITAGILAFSEGSPTGKSAFSTARALLADSDGDTDDDGPVPPCINQPGQRYAGCPGFTRYPGDDDGDGTCLMATRGCNGYRAVGDDQQSSPDLFSEGARMSDEPKEGAAPVVPPTPAPPAVDAQRAADDAEAQKIRASEAATLSEMRTTVATLSEENAALKRRLDEADQAARVEKVATRLKACLSEGKITMAEHKAFTENVDNLVRLSDSGNEFVISAIEARPKGGAVPLREIGHGGDAQAPVPTALSESMAAEIAKQREKGGKVDVIAAAKSVAEAARRGA